MPAKWISDGDEGLIIHKTTLAVVPRARFCVSVTGRSLGRLCGFLSPHIVVFEKKRPIFLKLRDDQNSGDRI
jgi:hypothetical protein